MSDNDKRAEPVCDEAGTQNVPDEMGPVRLDPIIAHRNQLRDRVWDQIVKKVRRDERFRSRIEPLGLVTAMDLVDGITDSVLAALATPTAPPAPRPEGE